MEDCPITGTIMMANMMAKTAIAKIPNGCGGSCFHDISIFKIDVHEVILKFFRIVCSVIFHFWTEQEILFSIFSNQGKVYTNI
jgi:hypothetical protein